MDNYAISRRLGELGVNDDLKKENNVVLFRSVISDVCVSEWHKMPEILPPNLYGLVEYVRKSEGLNFLELKLGFRQLTKNLPKTA